jgi:uncharacterized membrane protein
MNTVVEIGAAGQQPAEVDLHCPVCGGHNPADAVFCGNPDCGKALGEFRYVVEELRARTGFVQRVADQTNRLAGWPHFFTLHVLWMGIWFLLNTGLVAVFGTFDAYPYDMLGLILSVEATLLASLLLISNSRQNDYSNKRSELDYEVNVRTYRKVAQLERAVLALREQLEGNGRQP